MNDEQTSPSVQPPAPEPLTKALKEAAQSLRTVERLAGRGEYMMEFGEVRSYAGNRAKVAEDALATPSIAQRGAALTDEQIDEIASHYHSHRSEGAWIFRAEELREFARTLSQEVRPSPPSEPRG